MSEFTTFRTGGPASFSATPDTIGKLRSIIGFCIETGTKYYVIGRGSNILVSDSGIDGAVIFTSGLESIELENGGTIKCLAGTPLIRLCSFALENSLSGLEFAYGIPGSAGGAVYMNAGAYGGEMKDVALSVTALSPDGSVREVPAAEMALGYRTSVFKTNGDIILFAKYNLHTGDKSAIKAQMEEIMGRRKSKQPLEYPSAGSVFKRPEGAFAGTLIEQCGLKGKTVGGAQVSEKHAGFIINVGGATCDDVMELVKVVQDTVKAETGYILEREIIRTGR